MRAGTARFGGREAELAAPLVAVLDGAADLVRPAEDRAPRLRRRPTEQRPDARRRVRQRAHRPPSSRRRTRRDRDRGPRSRARRPCAAAKARRRDGGSPKWKSAPTITSRVRSAPASTSLTNPRRSPCCAPRRTSARRTRRRVRRVDQLQLLFEGGQHGRRRVGPHDLGRMVVEVSTVAERPRASARSRTSRKHRPMAEVDAVERADRRRRDRPTVAGTSARSR